MLHNAGFHGALPAVFTEQWRTAVIPLDVDLPVTRVALSRKQVQVADLRKDRAYLAGRQLAVALGRHRRDAYVGRGADAQGGRVDRRDRHLPPGGAPVHRQADRAGYKLRRPGRHRHREHAPAQRAARNRCSSRPRPPTCSRSSAARRSICRPCSIRWSSRRRGCARPNDGHQSRRETATSTVHRASYGFSPEFQEYHASSHPIAPGRGTMVGRAALEGKTVHIPDVLADPEYTLHEASKAGGIPHDARRSAAARRKLPIGVLSLTRPSAAPFTDKQIELVDDVRRPGGDRDRERAAVRRGAGSARAS